MRYYLIIYKLLFRTRKCKVINIIKLFIRYVYHRQLRHCLSISASRVCQYEKYLKSSMEVNYEIRDTFSHSTQSQAAVNCAPQSEIQDDIFVILALLVESCFHIGELIITSSAAVIHQVVSAIKYSHIEQII